MISRTPRSTEAVKKFLKARELREIGGDLSKRGADAEVEYSEAAELASQARDLLRPAGEVVRGCREALEIDPSAHPLDQLGLIETLDHPDSIGLDASKERLRLIEDARVLASALDAAQAIQASNSVEKMLAHQLAAVNQAALRLLARALGHPALPPIEMARLTNAAARMMDVYQGGLLALQKIRTGGKQTVVVQHVQVSSGGQAVIAGSMEQGGGGVGEGRAGENEDSTP